MRAVRRAELRPVVREARSTPRGSSPWVRSPAWDGFWMLGPLWLAPLALLLARGHEQPWDGPLDGLYLALTAAFWVGHRLSSTWLAYFTTAYRPVLRAQPIRFVIVPVVLSLLVFAYLLAPEAVLPVPFERRVMWLFLADYGFVTWHFAAQHYGCLSLYRLRAGQVRSTWARRIDRAYAVGVGGVLIVVAEVLAGEAHFREVWLDPVVTPALLDDVRPWVYGLGLGLVGVVTGAMLLREALDPHRSLPRAAYLLGLGAMAAAAFYLDFFLFLVLWTAQHWMAATGLASLAARGGEAPGASRWYRTWAFVNRTPVLLVLLLALLGTLLLPLMEVEAMEDPSAGYAPRLFPFLGDTLFAPGLVPWLVALGLVTAFVHYALDRAVWRFSDPAVRRAAASLLEPRA